MMFSKQMVQIEEKILHMLLGLNRKYYAGFKWLDEVIHRLEVKPDNFAQRIKEVHRLPPEKAAESISDLALGFKWKLLDQERFVVSQAVAGRG